MPASYASSSPVFDPQSSSAKWAFFFALAGILATGIIFGMGGANYWALLNVNPPFGEAPVTARGDLLGVAVGAVAIFLDFIAFLVILDGAVTVVQRARGRM